MLAIIIVVAALVALYVGYKVANGSESKPEIVSEVPTVINQEAFSVTVEETVVEEVKPKKLKAEKKPAKTADKVKKEPKKTVKKAKQ